MNVYCDESGGFGWIFDKPYGIGKGGSSRYLTIAFLLLPPKKSHLPKRIVKKIYQIKGQSTRIELKGTKLTTNNKVFFATEVVKLLKKHPEINVFNITVNKRKVEEHIRKDPNKLYNYMVSLALLDRIKELAYIEFIPDKRTIKIKSGNSLVDYLQIKLWFEYNSHTIIHNLPQESHRNLNLQFIDYIANIIWSKYERNNSTAYDVLTQKVESNHLFF